MEQSFVNSCDDEIDLIELVRTLWKGKWIIAAVMLVMGGLAFGVSAAMPRQYQASASIIVTAPKIQINARNDTQSEPQSGFVFSATVPDLKAVSALAKAPDVFQALTADAEIEAAWQGEKQPLTWQTLAGKASISVTGEQGLQLTVHDTNRARAALIANRWAEEVVKRINQNFGYASTLDDLAAKTQDAYQTYQKAEAAYQRALLQNRQTAIAAQLHQAQSDLQCILARQSDIQRLQSDLRLFDNYLQGASAERLTPGDALALMTLQQRVLATKVCMTDTPTLQVQWSTADSADTSLADATAVIKEMQTVLQQRARTLLEQQQASEQQVQQLQHALESEKSALVQATYQRDAAREVYHSFIQLQARVKALATQDNQLAAISAKAVAPTTPVVPRLFMNVVLAVVTGMILGSLGVLMATWWRNQTAVGEEE